MRKILGRIVYTSRWMLYPINLGLLLALALYIVEFLLDDFRFIRGMFLHEDGATHNLEGMMIVLLGFVDAAMVANLIIMIVQGGHQIFIGKFDELSDKAATPQYLDHIDTGILKVKVALSISSITLVQILKDFVHIEKVDWVHGQHRIVIHVITLLSALIMALIWRITHPPKGNKDAH